MRHIALAVLLFLVVALDARAQALDSELVHGRDYVFERRIATREVRDAQDTGTIQLVTYVFRPLKNDRGGVVLFSHGSTGGLTTGAKEPGNGPPGPMVRFFMTRGYTVVAPWRRGRNESSGTYVEECSVFLGECTVEDQVALSERALREALLDTNAVLDQLVLGRMIPADGQVIAAGHSRGGFLSLLLAGERPKAVKAVVNFSGGWHGVTDRLGAEANRNRMADHAARLSRAAKTATSPTFWVYAARDPLYQDSVPQALVAAWRDAGGKAELVHVTNHTLPNAHLTPQAPALWAEPLGAFLKTLDAPR